MTFVPIPERSFLSCRQLSHNGACVKSYRMDPVERDGGGRLVARPTPVWSAIRKLARYRLLARHLPTIRRAGVFTPIG
jgi:hypothetical protein